MTDSHGAMLVLTGSDSGVPMLIIIAFPPHLLDDHHWWWSGSYASAEQSDLSCNNLSSTDDCARQEELTTPQGSSGRFSIENMFISSVYHLNRFSHICPLPEWLTLHRIWCKKLISKIRCTKFGGEPRKFSWYCKKDQTVEKGPAMRR